MTEIQIDAGTLTASQETRTATGLLVPFGEEGRTNLGRFSIGPGVMSIPEDFTGLSLNIEHDRSHPVGALLTAHETDIGIVGTFGFAKTPQGDAALAGIADGSRRHLSVEATGIVLRAGRAIAGRIFGGALVATPAFPSATLLAAAADIGEAPEPTEEVHEETTTAPDGSEIDTKTTVTEEIEDLGDGKSRKTTTTVVVEESTPPAEGVTPVTTPPAAPAATVPPTLLGRFTRPGQAPAMPVAAEPRGVSKEMLFAALAAAATPDGDERLEAFLAEQSKQARTMYARKGNILEAALTDVPFNSAADSGGKVMVQPQWIGELWSGRDYQRRYLPLFAGTKPLTAFSVQGYKWTSGPAVAPWAGNKSNVPSNAIDLDPFSQDASRLAGAWDVAREYRDFNVPGFWESFFKFATDSYAKQSDTGVFALALAGATAVVAGTVPTGVPSGLVSIVDGAIAVLDEGVPTFAVVAKDVWRDLLLTPKDKTVEYLSSALSLEEGQLEGFKIVPSRGADLANGHVLVGVNTAVTPYELPGSPIRVEGLDMVKGGVDPGLFGYYTAIVENGAALAHVTPKP